MKLYYYPGACSLSPHIVAREAGLKLDLERVDFETGKTETGAEFARIHPKGYVPALQLDDGGVLTEGAVIVQYLADQAPSSGLLPPSGLERYRVQEWLNYIGTEVHKGGFAPLFASNQEQVRAWAKEGLAARFAFLEEQLRGKQFLLGGTFTVADAYLFTVLSWASYVQVPLPAGLGDYLGRISARPAVQAALKAEGLVGAK